MALACLPALSACESFYEAEAVRTHPAPGKLVDIGSGRRIQIECQGEGGPTVVFQAGGDTLGSLGWKPVMEQVSAKTRACAYSRAGILWSDPARGPFEPEEVARDLHAALEAAGEKPPYLLVGHSRGGLYNMIFAGLYRSEIAGMVFADSSHPDQEVRFKEAGLQVGAESLLHVFGQLFVDVAAGNQFLAVNTARIGVFFDDFPHGRLCKTRFVAFVVAVAAVAYHVDKHVGIKFLAILGG